jgi:hypothetical protein
MFNLQEKIQRGHLIRFTLSSIAILSIAPLQFVFSVLYDNDCGTLIPPCWQEFHYLYAGIVLGFIIGLYTYKHVRKWFVNDC